MPCWGPSLNSVISCCFASSDNPLNIPREHADPHGELEQRRSDGKFGNHEIGEERYREKRRRSPWQGFQQAAAGLRGERLYE